MHAFVHTYRCPQVQDCVQHLRTATPVSRLTAKDRGSDPYGGTHSNCCTLLRRHVDVGVGLFVEHDCLCLQEGVGHQPRPHGAEAGERLWKKDARDRNGIAGLYTARQIPRHVHLQCPRRRALRHLCTRNRRYIRRASSIFPCLLRGNTAVPGID